MNNSKISALKNGQYKINSFYLLGFIKLFSITENSQNTYYKIFGIPILRIKKSPNRKEYKLFSFIPIFKIKEKSVSPYKYLDRHYAKVKKHLRQRINQGKKIRVGFYIVEVFQYASIYESMLKSDFFEPCIVVVPDYARKERLLSCLESTYDLLKQRYNNVKLGYDIQKNKYLDFSDEFDIIFFSNPYQWMAHKYHFIWHILKKNILTCYQGYAYDTVSWARNYFAKSSFCNTCWKVFAASKENYDDLALYQPRKAENVWISGYAKMDNLIEYKQIPSLRKRILLCPHHTINFKSLQLSNFLKYADFFLELPEKYPDIDFIFRPHPLLYYSLSKYWSKERAQKYYNKIASYPNVTYDTDINYFQTFMNSDAIIHDCGSFTAEYLFTGKPGCFMLKDEEEIADTFLPIGQECLKNYYKAFNKDEICNFIENVVISGKDLLKEQREKFSNYLKLNYPHVGEKITNYIKQEILNDNM